MGEKNKSKTERKAGITRKKLKPVEKCCQDVQTTCLSLYLGVSRFLLQEKWNPSTPSKTIYSNFLALPLKRKYSWFTFRRQILDWKMYSNWSEWKVYWKPAQAFLTFLKVRTCVLVQVWLCIFALHLVALLQVGHQCHFINQILTIGHKYRILWGLLSVHKHQFNWTFSHLN